MLPLLRNEEQSHSESVASLPLEGQSEEESLAYSAQAVAAGGGGGGAYAPGRRSRGGAPSGCNFKKKSKLSNKNKQILTRNERTGYPQSHCHVAKNAIDSRKCVSFWGSAPDPLAAALFWLLTIEVERLGALIHCPAPGR